ncbi:MAG: hypothetical protein SGBAC_012446 [Bacillariaceae sp.]
MVNAKSIIESITSVEEPSVSSHSEYLDDASSYHSHSSSAEDEDESGETDSQSSCSCSISTSSSASYSIASNEGSDDEDDDDDDDDESHDGGEKGDESSSSEYHDHNEEEDDSQEDWSYKFFPPNENCRVRFSAETEVYDTLSRNDFTPQEKMASFLSPKDKKAQSHRQNKTIAKLELWIDESPERRTMSNMRTLYRAVDANNGDPKFIGRGLHQMTDKGYDRMNDTKNMCVDSVLEEQEAQWKAWQKENADLMAAFLEAEEEKKDAEMIQEPKRLMWDWERMAQISLQFSKGSIVESIKIAKRDEQQAQKAYLQFEKQEAKKKKMTEKKKKQQQEEATAKSEEPYRLASAAAAAAAAKKTNATNKTKNNSAVRSPVSITPTTVATTLTSCVSASSNLGPDFVVNLNNSSHHNHNDLEDDEKITNAHYQNQNQQQQQQQQQQEQQLLLLQDTFEASYNDMKTTASAPHRQDSLDSLEVLSVDSTLTGDRSILTYDDRSIVTPTEESTLMTLQFRQRLSLQEQQHPCKAVHAAILKKNYKGGVDTNVVIQ